MSINHFDKVCITVHEHRVDEHTKVPIRVLQHFMHNASVTSVKEANAHSADWLVRFFCQ